MRAALGQLAQREASPAPQEAQSEPEALLPWEQGVVTRPQLVLAG